jgi:hypothetical protein
MESTIINEQLIELKEENEELRELLEQQSGKLARAVHAIYQLHAGLYNIRTQNYNMQLANALLKDEPLPTEPSVANHVWPTTRQGDHHEKRISYLEEMVKKLEEKIIMMEHRHV